MAVPNQSASSGMCLQLNFVQWYTDSKFLQPSSLCWMASLTASYSFLYSRTHAAPTTSSCASTRPQRKASHPPMHASTVVWAPQDYWGFLDTCSPKFGRRFHQDYVESSMKETPDEKLPTFHAKYIDKETCTGLEPAPCHVDMRDFEDGAVSNYWLMKIAQKGYLGLIFDAVLLCSQTAGASLVSRVNCWRFLSALCLLKYQENVSCSRFMIDCMDYISNTNIPVVPEEL